jgi:hypothetical protein
MTDEWKYLALNIPEFDTLMKDHLLFWNAWIYPNHFNWLIPPRISSWLLETWAVCLYRDSGIDPF